MTIDERLFTPDPYVTAAPATDSVTSFQLILSDFLDRRLQIPEHQRDGDAWDFDKRRKYVARLRNSAQGRHPPGSFATYQVIEAGKRPTATFLNDGLQRLTALRDLLSDPSRFDMDEDGVAALLQQRISICHRHYSSHDDAMRDFQLINYGTRLTPYELCQGFLKYTKGYREYWENLLADVGGAVQDSEARLQVSTRSKRKGRVQEHKRRRHTLSLFYRFLIQEKRPIHYPDVAAETDTIQKYVDDDDVVELRLGRVLLDRGHEDARSNVRQFRQLVYAETAMLEKCIQRILGSGYGLTSFTHRWLLDLAVWRRNNQISRDLHERFVQILVEKTQGTGRWPYESDGKQKNLNLGLTQLNLLPRLAEFAGMPEFCEKPRRPRRVRPQLLPGYDHSHIEPFVVNGDGPTFPEPAPKNRSRGAQPVDLEDLPTSSEGGKAGA